jgi:hypothetical protein
MGGELKDSVTDWTIETHQKLKVGTNFYLGMTKEIFFV